MKSIATQESMMPVNFEYFTLNEEGGLPEGVDEPISKERDLGVRFVTLFFRGESLNPS